MMRFKEPLTKQALQEIQDRNPRRRGDQQSDDLYAALWEIHRLRAMVLRADQLQRAYGGSVFGGGLALVLEAFRADMAREPCVLEMPVLRELSAGARMKPGGDLDRSEE